MQTRDLLVLLPSKPSDDPRSEISTRLHGFTSDIARQVEGMPNIVLGSASSRGLIQTINPTLEQFRRAIRSTAPNFRPFEKGDVYRKHLHEASFLRSEEGGECEDEASDTENEDEASDSEDEDGDDVLVSLQRKRKRLGKNCSKIYIDEVLEAAQL